MKLPIHLPLEAIVSRGMLAPAAAVGAALLVASATYVIARALTGKSVAAAPKLLGQGAVETTDAKSNDEEMVDLAAEEQAEALFV